PAAGTGLEELGVERAVGHERGGALEAVAGAGDDVDDVDLEGRIVPQVLDRARRAQVGEDEVVVVPDGRRALGRQGRAPVGTDGRDEAQLLLANDPLHVFGQDTHVVLLLLRAGRGASSRAAQLYAHA